MRLVLVEPEYDMNVGAICRVMKNFAFNELYLVRPACPLGFNATMFAKHAIDVLKKAHIVNSLDEALEGFVIATSAIKRPNSIALKEFTPPPSSFTLLFGREGEGLHSNELAKADALIHIETSPNYPTLSLVNSVAITLYHLSSFPLKHVPTYQKKIDVLLHTVASLGDKDLLRSVRSLVLRSSLNESELNSLLKHFKTFKNLRLE